MSTPLQGTASGVKDMRIRYTHDAMIDMIIENPAISQADIAKNFGMSQTWISRVFGADTFQARLAERKTELIDPQLVASIELRLQGLAMQSIDAIQRKLELNPMDTSTALKALELSTKSLGYGARQEKVSIQNSFVVALPNQAASAAEWSRKHGGDGEAVVIDITPKADRG